jgi:hypothetical protein
VVCTGRGKHSLVKLRLLQLARDGDTVRLLWDSRQGPAPVAARRADGTQTFVLRCGTCRRHLETGEAELVKAALALAEHQGVRDDDNTPVVMDLAVLAAVI